MMCNAKIDSLSTLEKMGRRYERELDLDNNYLAPLPREKTSIPEVACPAQPAARAKVAIADETAALSDAPGGVKAKKSDKKKKKRVERVAPAEEDIEEEEIAAAQATTAQRPSVRTGARPKTPYAAVTATGPSGASQASGPPVTMPMPGTPVPAAPATGIGLNSPVEGATSKPRGPMVCYQCSQPGHRASECPQTQCYVCRQFGYRAVACPLRARQNSLQCQVCGKPGVEFKTCPDCAALRQSWGNAQAGGGGSNVPCPPVAQRRDEGRARAREEAKRRARAREETKRRARAREEHEYEKKRREEYEYEKKRREENEKGSIKSRLERSGSATAEAGCDFQLNSDVVQLLEGRECLASFQQPKSTRREDEAMRETRGPLPTPTEANHRQAPEGRGERRGTQSESRYADAPARLLEEGREDAEPYGSKSLSLVAQPAESERIWAQGTINQSPAPVLKTAPRLRIAENGFWGRAGKEGLCLALGGGSMPSMRSDRIRASPNREV